MKTSSLKVVCLGMTVMLGLSLHASAQFNGPGISGGVPLNQPTTLTTDQTILYPAARDIKMHQGDVLAIHLFGASDYSPNVTIGIDGKVLLPLIGVISLDGLTVTQGEQLIASKLQSAGMYKDPQITIQITEGPNAAVTLIGEAHGVIPVVGQRRLLDILAASGGLPGTASHVITIERPGVSQPIVVDLGTDPARSAAANIPIFPGDTIITGRVGVVYVVGAFKGGAGVISLSQNTPLTLMEATALSGGLPFEGKYNDLRIIRTNGEQRSVVKLDLKKVLDGKAPDPILQANDIIYLPSSTIKGSITNGSLSTILSVFSVALSTFALLYYR